jgi:hypothetical protein
MKGERAISTYLRLREQALWRLLAADNGPIILGLLETHLMEEARSLPASILFDRLGRSLEELRGHGQHLPQTAQSYVAHWLAAGYLERRFPPGATEEEYELSSAAEGAIRVVSSLVEPRTAATESRLAVVIQQLVRLAEETDPNPETRVAALLAERDRIDRQIEAIRGGAVPALDGPRARERVREAIALADSLAGDFRRVRDQFELLNRDLRGRIMDEESSRGEVLEALFAGADLIADSEAGRTFAAFWRLLTDPEQSTALDQSIESVLSREFAGTLEARERRFLLRITRTLLDQGGMVHEVLQSLARSLKNFVQSREYLEQRRVNQVLREAQRASLALKDKVKAAEPIAFTLELSSSRLRSVAQWTLFDPAAQAPGGGMVEGEAALIGLEDVGDLVAQSEIDFRVLKANILAMLEAHSQASIGDVLAQFPAAQGLGSVVGYMALGARHGLRGEHSEHVEWCGMDRQWRSARIPAIYFLRERADELA